MAQMGSGSDMGEPGPSNSGDNDDNDDDDDGPPPLESA
jgi:hypothetical protein